MIIINFISLCTNILVHFIREEEEKYNMSLETEITRKFSGVGGIVNAKRRLQVLTMLFGQ